METVIAEKLQTIVKLGIANSRMKDYYDLDALAAAQEFDGALLRTPCRAPSREERPPFHKPRQSVCQKNSSKTPRRSRSGDFRIADTFTDSLTRLAADEQKAVKTTAFDLQMDPSNPGMQFHRLDRAKDPNFWSVRVSSDIRLIVHRTGSSLLLCYVAHHDDAYAWAERRKIEHASKGHEGCCRRHRLPRGGESGLPIHVFSF